MGIAEAIVDGLQPGGAAIGEVGKLHGGGAAGEDQRPAAIHVHGQIDQEIDAIGDDEIGGGGIGKAGNGSPLSGLLLQVGGHGIDDDAAVVTDGGKVLAVVGAQEREQKTGDRMGAEMG